MATNSPDILLLFGIEGGGDTTSGSGRLISESLAQIIRTVEEQITTQIRVGVSDESLNRMVSRIEEAFNNANFTINVTGNAVMPQDNGAGGGAGQGTGGTGNQRRRQRRTANNNDNIQDDGAQDNAQIANRVNAALNARHRDLVNQIRQSLENSEEELVRSMFTTDRRNRINREIAVTRNRLTGEEYTRTFVPTVTNGTRNYNAFELSEIQGGDNQIQNYLTDVSRRLGEIQEQRNRLLQDHLNQDGVDGLFGEETLPGLTRLDNILNQIGREINNITDSVNGEGVFSETEEDLSSLQNRLAALFSDANRNLSQLRKNSNDLGGLQEALPQSISKYNELWKNFSLIDKSKYTEVNGSTTQAYQELDKQLNATGSLIDAIQEVNAAHEEGRSANVNWAKTGVEGVNSYETALQALPERLKEIARLQKELNVNGTAYSDTYIESTARSYYDTLQKASKLNPTVANGKSYANDVRTYITELDKAKATQEELSQSGREAFNRLKEHFLGVVSEAKQLNTTYKELEVSERRQKNAITQNNKIYSEATRYYKENESGIRRNIALNQQWQTLLKDTLSGKYLNNTQGLRTALAELQTQTKLAGAEVKTLWAQVKKLFTDHFGSISATAVIGTAVNTLRNVYEKVKDIDSAMTELKKVTELTESQYESFGKTAKRVADSVGGTISDTISAVADFSRLGYGIGDATKLAEAAIVYKNVGDGIEDIGTASQSIISTMKAFGIESDKAMFIVDKFNEVGKELPTAHGKKCA